VRGASFAQRQVPYRQVSPVARDLHATGAGLVHRRGDVAGGDGVFRHALARQTDAIENQITAIDGARGYLNTGQIGRHQLGGRTAEIVFQLVLAARDHSKRQVIPLQRLG